MSTEPIEERLAAVKKRPVFLPPVDGPTITPSQPYRIDTAQQLVPEPPQPFAEYEDTFR